MIHLDHHKILPAWDAVPPHDDSNNFNPDAFLSDSPKPASNFSADNQNPPQTTALPVTQQDTEDPAVVSHTSPTQPSPQSQADPNPSSPSVAERRSSPLSPLPDPVSPQTHIDSASSPAPPTKATTSTTEEDKESDEASRPRASSIAIKAGLEQSSSRQSTPLSEPPDQEDDADPPTSDLKDGMPEESAGAGVNGVAEANESKHSQVNGGADMASESRQDANASSSWNNVPTPRNYSGPSNDSNAVLPSPTVPSPSSSTSQTSDPKVVTVLELNAELLKVFMEFQSRGVQMNNDSIASQYFARLQSNLAWLAAAADQSRQGNPSTISLPMMDPPASVDFTSTERIRQLYSTLPSIFAKEMARRQQAVLSSVNASSVGIPSLPGTPTPNPPTTPSINHLKRDRPHDTPMSNEHPNIKRRDTGESKPVFEGVAPQPNPPNNTANTNTNIGMNTGNPMSQTPNPNQFGLNLANGNTSGVALSGNMVGPSTSSFGAAGTMGTNVVNTAEAQLAASNRERARQMQIRQAQQIQMQQQQQRQMSPPSAPGMTNPQMANQQMQNPAMNNNSMHSNVPISNMSNGGGSASAGAMGMGASNSGMNPAQGQGGVHPNFQQMYQILQTPNHPFVNYMVRNVPGFATLPLQAQLQKMLLAQNALQQQREQHRLSNMGGGGGGNMSPTAAVNGQQFQSHDMSPISPVVNSPSMPQGGQGGGFPMSANLGQGGMDGRMQMQMSPQGMTQQQRQQLYLLQQQARANGGAAGNNPQAMMYALQQQERMRQQMGQQQQQVSSPTIGSPMSGGNIPDLSSLRSTTGIPGIARSARSPSDNAPSPLTPRVPTRGPSMGQEDYQRMMMAQQAQANRNMSTRSPAAGFSQGTMQNPASWQQNQMLHQQGMGGGGYGGTQQQQQNWGQQQQSGNAGYPFAPSPVGELPQTPRHMSATPAPQNTVDQSTAGLVGSSDFDLLNWSQ